MPWQPHVEAVLREYMLVMLGDDTDQLAIDSHAAAARALTLLREQIPEPDLGEDPEALMATVTEPMASCERLVLKVPSELLLNFHVLDRTLKAALTMADAEAFLTPPTQPELRDLRRWLCDQVLVQAAGSPPTPWSPPLDAGPPPRSELAVWDLAAVSESDQAVLAADDTNRIVAVSVPALHLLGYSERSELEGSRIVDIVPSRYRQAHLAGFTLHLATGRSPLLGRPVLVPALRRDGTEQQVELTVTVDDRPHGHRLFVATLRPVSSAR